MSYVHARSKQCGKTETDLFSIPPTQASLEKGRWIDYHPLSSVENDDGPITFLAAGTEDYVDLSKTILFVEGKVVKSDGTTDWIALTKQMLLLSTTSYIVCSNKSTYT